MGCKGCGPCIVSISPSRRYSERFYEVASIHPQGASTFGIAVQCLARSALISHTRHTAAGRPCVSYCRRSSVERSARELLGILPANESSKLTCSCKIPHIDESCTDEFVNVSGSRVLAPLARDDKYEPWP